MPIEREMVLESAYYDTAKKAIVLNGTIEGRQVQVPMPESVFEFHKDMNKEQEMMKTAAMFDARRGLNIKIQSPES